MPLICLLLAGFVWVVFGQTIGHQFINYDDPAYVLENAHIRGGLTSANVCWAFTHVHGQNWHPLTSMSHMLDCQLFGINPRWHHAINVFFHSLAAVLLFLALTRMTNSIWPSALVSAVFAIHPLRVESVAWIAERKDVLSGVFFMLTLLAYDRYARRRSTGSYIAAALCLSCGVMSKPMLVTTPLVLLLLDYWPLQRTGGKRLVTPGLILEKIPLFAISLGAILATIWAQNFALGSTEALPLAYRLMNAALSYCTYIGQMCWPVHLIPFYPHPESHTPAWQWITACIALIWMSIFVFVRREINPYLLVGWFWYMIMLLPVAGLIQVGLQGHADRYTYLPQIGLLIAVVWSARDLGRRVSGRSVEKLASLTTAGKFRSRLELSRSWLVPDATATIIVLLFALLAWKQTRHWHDSESLWRYTLGKTPESDVAHTGLAGILQTQGKTDEAIAHYRTAIAIRAGNPGAQYGLATALARDGKTDEAMEHYRIALNLQPDDVAASDELALLLVSRGDYADAISQWENSLRFEADDGNAVSNLAWVLATCEDKRLRDPSRAVQFAERANQLAKGSNAIILRTLAIACAQAGQFDRAREAADHGIVVAEAHGQNSIAQDLRRCLDLFSRGERPFP